MSAAISDVLFDSRVTKSESRASDRDQGFLPAIQGLRGVAAMSVLFVHLYDMPLLAGFMPRLSPWLH